MKFQVKEHNLLSEAKEDIGVLEFLKSPDGSTCFIGDVPLHVISISVTTEYISVLGYLREIDVPRRGHPLQYMKYRLYPITE